MVKIIMMEENEVSKRVKVEVMEVKSFRVEIHNLTEWKSENWKVMFYKVSIQY